MLLVYCHLRFSLDGNLVIYYCLVKKKYVMPTKPKGKTHKRVVISALLGKKHDQK